MALLDRQLQRLGRDFEEKGGSSARFYKVRKVKPGSSAFRSAPLVIIAMPCFLPDCRGGLTGTCKH